MRWANLFQAGLLVALLVPNAIYARWHDFGEEYCASRMFHRPEQIEWYGTMLFLVFGFGFYNAAFATDASFTL